MPLKKPVGVVHYFRSSVDNEFAPCAVCDNNPGGPPRPLILEVTPGLSAANISKAVENAEEIARIAGEQGLACVVLRPTGARPGSLYENYGEVDLLEALEFVLANYPIDRDRISITGSSMGGAATWFHASHFPDLYAAAAPFCGYCDYRLWEKPGGLTFAMNPWEEPSWRSRSAALLVENLMHTPVWMVHGEWDRSVGGGVPVEHSRQMDRLMTEKGFEHKISIMPKAGHWCRLPEIWPQVIAWLLSQKKHRDPKRVSLATFELRHNRSYWVRIDQMIDYSKRALVEAALEDSGRLAATTENVLAVTLGPVPATKAAEVAIDGQAAGTIKPGEAVTFVRDGQGRWSAGGAPAASAKRRGASGPIADMFFDRAILVPGTAGTEEETFYNDWLSRNAVGYFANRNGGVHRGGIMGQSSVQLPIVPDKDLTDDDARNCNLLLYGTPGSNAIFKRWADKIPLSFHGDRIHLAGKTYTADGVAVLAVFPHPENPKRYVAVHGGTRPDAITWGSHLDLMLLPDYVVYAGGRVLEWGFWGNEWK